MTNYKWRFALGTTSRIPGKKGQHYLILDIDGDIPFVLPENLTEVGVTKMIWMRTRHGWHIYTDLKVSWKKLPKLLRRLGADKTWIDIGEVRGYFFLADYDLVTLPWPIERMALRVTKKREERNTTRT